MKEFKNENFWGLFDRGGKLLFEDLMFEGCCFSHSGLSMTTDVNRMTTVRNVRLTNCAVDGVSVGPTIFRNVTVNNLKTSDLFIVWCPYLDRVTLTGEIGKMKVNATASHETYKNSKQKPFDDYRDEFYTDVEWALDISEAHFKEFDIRGVPGRLIRRDPESQVLVKRERALEVATPGWEKQLNPANKLWPFMINLFLSDGDADTVLVAPLAAAKAKREPLLRGLQELRRIGLVEPD